MEFVEYPSGVFDQPGRNRVITWQTMLEPGFQRQFQSAKLVFEHADRPLSKPIRLRFARVRKFRGSSMRRLNRYYERINITIVDNTFINASRCVPDPYHAGTAPSMLSVIGSAVVGPNTSPFGTVPEPFVRVAYHGAQNISIVNNTIDTWFRGAGVLLGEVSGGVVRGNTIARPPDVDAPAVDVSDSDSIRVEDNLLIGGWSAIEGDGEGSAAAVRVAKNTTGVEVAHSTLRQS